MFEPILIYLALGGLSGLAAGMFGIGGGVVIVPVLTILFAAQEVAPQLVVHLALGTSLGSIAITSLSAMREHHRRGAVQWSVFRRLTPGVALGALLGAAVADMLPTKTLRVVFGVFELAIAAQIGFELVAPKHRQLPGAFGMNAAGVAIGAFSALLGIGGGTLTVPFLVWCNVSIRQAVATASACGLPISLGGALGFVLVGWHASDLPSWSTGYLYWPALVCIAAASLVSAPIGARLAHTLPINVLRRAFSVVLALLGVKMLLG